MSLFSIRVPGARSVEPLILLLATGGLIGASVPLAKLAAQAGVPPVVWALVTTLGPGMLLTAFVVLGGHPLPLAASYRRYCAIAGLISTALPNLILYTVVPHLGAGLTAVVFTLPPLLTLGLAALVGIERPGPVRLFGIGLGFVGAFMIVGPRGSLPSADLLGWMLFAFAVPFSLAAGNVYRTARWPAGASPLSLAAGTLLAGGGWIGLAILVSTLLPNPLSGGLADAVLIARGLDLAILQILVSAFSFVLFFRLQQVAGPVYLSQIGYVITAVGLASGALAFGESYSPWVWAAVLVIATGVGLVNASRPRAVKRPA